jgi:hypothetical protein
VPIKFVDFGRQLGLGPRRFGFWEGRYFFTANGSQSWKTFDEFSDDHRIQSEVFERMSTGSITGIEHPTLNLDNFRALCPPWVFGG